jgi:hypothetical protein
LVSPGTDVVSCPRCGTGTPAARHPIDAMVRCVVCAHDVSDALYRRLPKRQRPSPPIHPLCDFWQAGTWPRWLQPLWWGLHPVLWWRTREDREIAAGMCAPYPPALFLLEYVVA